MDEQVVEQLRRNLTSIQQRIAESAEKSGRRAEDVKLIAITKYVDADVVRALVDIGCHTLGESRPQVLWEKAEALADLDIQWHLVGHLQRNKVRRTLKYARVLHSVDSLRLLQTIDQAAQESRQIIECLLEVNISGEQAKHGFHENELAPVFESARNFENVHICGLMGMASLSGSTADNQNEFARLREIRDRFRNEFSGFFQLPELSMGMSGDFEAAIAEGSTMVRIGSALLEGAHAS
jgi:pyridoxal phosphate enzyme (YggS family)